MVKSFSLMNKAKVVSPRPSVSDLCRKRVDSGLTEEFDKTTEDNSYAHNSSYSSDSAADKNFRPRVLNPKKSKFAEVIGVDSSEINEASRPVSRKASSSVIARPGKGVCSHPSFSPEVREPRALPNFAPFLKSKFALTNDNVRSCADLETDVSPEERNANIE